MMGRGLGTPHLSSQGQSSIPRVGLDYFYITSGGIKKEDELGITNQELEDGLVKGDIVKCIVIRDWDNKSVWAHVIPQKGLDDDYYTARLIVKDLRWMGHGRLILKFDNESPLRAVAKKVVDLFMEDSNSPVVDITLENPPTYDSQSNGGDRDRY